jgi:hypothetical protein
METEKEPVKHSLTGDVQEKMFVNVVFTDHSCSRECDAKAPSTSAWGACVTALSRPPMSRSSVERGRASKWTITFA